MESGLDPGRSAPDLEMGAPPPADGPLRILAADDDPLALAVLARVLAKHGYRVIKAVDGLEAWRAFQQPDPPPLAILDRVMPGLDGIDLIRKVRSLPCDPSPYLLMVTARDDKADVVAALEAGANDYLTKPFDPDELHARIQVGRRLVEMQSELRDLNASLERRVADRTRELQAVQSQLYVNEKMASIGQLAAGVAHEINNPVSFVATNFAALEKNMAAFSNLLSAYRETFAILARNPGMAPFVERLAEVEKRGSIDFILQDLPKLFAESREGFRRITSIVDSMRGFARKDAPGAFQAHDLNAGIRDTLVIARNAYKYGAEIDLQLSDIPAVPCIPGQINQVLLNLIVNAAQAIGAPPSPGSPKGTIRIRTGHDDTDVFCTIEDTGPGIPPRVAPHVFDPFFTTKAPGQGTGLGLSISHDIVVLKHGGTLTFQPSELGGAAFRLTLPITRPPPPARGPHE